MTYDNDLVSTLPPAHTQDSSALCLVAMGSKPESALVPFDDSDDSDLEIDASLHLRSRPLAGCKKGSVKQEASSSSSPSSSGSTSSSLGSLSSMEGVVPPKKQAAKGRASRKRPVLKAVGRPGAKRGAKQAQREPRLKASRQPRANKQKQPKEGKQSKKEIATQRMKERLDSFKMTSTEPLKWAERLCKYAMERRAQCHYKTISLFSEFSGSTCPESAAASLVNHMSNPPELRFVYTADIKSACRQVQMSTRPEPSVQA